MSTQKIPSAEKQTIQSNVGDYSGNVWSTFNIDLDSNPGTIKTSKRLSRVLDTDFWGSDDVVQALQIHDGYFYVATTDAVARCLVSADPTDANNWFDVATLSLENLGFETDMTSFGGLLLISLDTEIMSWTGASKDDDWWTTIAGGTALTAGKTHTMQVLRSQEDTLYITDGSSYRYYNASSAPVKIDLEPLMTANCLTSSLDRMWVGTYTEVENNAYIYESNPGTDTSIIAYEVDGRACLTMFTYKNTPYVITERGYIQGFNGAGFQTVAQFPWADQSKVMEGCRPGLVQDSATSRAIHPKGVQVSGRYAYIYVNAKDEYSSTDNLSTRGASGVWVLDLETNSLTHRYALTNDTTDTGVHKVERSGPLLLTNTPDTRIMVGGAIDTVEGVWMEGATTPASYFVTTRHESESIADAFENAIVKADTLESGESIEVKYKDATMPNFPLLVDDISWLSANQFTTTNALTNVEVGHEVEVIAGYYAGKLAQITDVTGGTTKTVTLDTDFGLLGEFSDVQIDNWKRIESPHTASDGEYKKTGDNKVSHFRQHKVIMTGDVTLRQFISSSNAKITL